MNPALTLARVLAALAVALAAGCAHQADAARPPAGPEAAMDADRIELTPLLSPAELGERVARFAPTPLAFDPARFSGQELQALRHLLEAARIMDDLFWQQASWEGPALRARLARPRDAAEAKLLELLTIHAGAYDRLEGGKAFLRASLDGRELTAPVKPAGATFYPADMSKAELEAHLAAQPEDTAAFQGTFTVLRREGGRLVAVPYSRHHAEALGKAASALEAAAGLVPAQSLATYLRSRAQALRTNDYYQSDVDWVSVRDSAIEVTLGPYEVYEDALLNYKGAFEAFITLRDQAESAKLAAIEGTLQAQEDNLPLPPEFRSPPRTQESPLLVVDLLYSAGDTRAGVQTLAFNLPNDERVREQKGSKKVMLKNISHAKFDKILTPIAGRALQQGELEKLSFDAYFTHTLMHEIAHGLGPGFIDRDGAKTTVNLALKELYSPIEEAKADILGVLNTLFLVERGVLPRELAATCETTFLAGVFRSVRFGVDEAHGKADLLLFNALLERGAYVHDPSTGRFRVDPAVSAARVRELAGEILGIEARGDYEGARALLERYGRVRPEMRAVLDRLGDVPVDIRPIFEIEAKL
ncbi:MAG TPA: peptidase [Myxococcota bacterium]|nr:peptidase [Myxococcota bacterium]HRY92916.1 peptidase [Myxococcota bacterium]HSA19865.1 peptidase [Myxococcota bacterium]